MGVPNNLRIDYRLSRKFSEIAKAPVEVYFNNRSRFYELWYKGQKIIGLLDGGITTKSQKAVRDHFAQLRYGVGFKRYHRERLSDPFTKKDEQDDKEVDEYWYDSRKELEKAMRNPITISG